MSTEVARIDNQGNLKLTGSLNTRLPSITNGLVAHFPMDGNGGTFDMIGGNQPIQHTTGKTNLIEAMNMDWRDPNNWETHSGMEWDEGKQAMKITGYHNTWLKTPIIVDTSKHYQVSIEVMEEVQSSTGLYLGGLCNNSVGERVTGNFDYSYAANAQPITGVWTTYKTTRYGTGNIVSRTSQSFGNTSGWTGDRAVTDKLTKNYYYGGLFNYSSGGVLYIRNLSIVVIDDDNSNCTISNDGIAVEEATTNYLSSGLNGYDISLLSSWNGDGTFTNVGINEQSGTPIFRYGTTGSSYRYSHDYILDDDLTTLSSKVVTFSLWVRRLEGNATGQIRIYDNISGYSYASIHATKEFQLFKMTKTLGANPTRIFVMIDNTGGGTYEFHSPQLEQKSFATSHVIGSRSSGKMNIPIDVINFDEGTIACWFKPSKGFFSQSAWNRVFGHSTSTNYNEIQVKRNNTGNNLVMSISNNSSSPQTTWSACPSANIIADTWYHVVAKWSISNQRMSLTVDGVKKQQSWTTAHQPTVKGSFDIGYHSFIDRLSDSQFKDFSVYSRELTDEETTQLAKPHFNLQSNGDLIANSIQSRPLNIPNDAIYFPLGAASKDEFKTVEASAEANTAYEDGSVWVGSATTNLSYNKMSEYEPYHTIASQIGGTVTLHPTGTNKTIALQISGLSGAAMLGKTYTISGVIKRNGVPQWHTSTRLNTYNTALDSNMTFNSQTGEFTVVEYNSSGGVWIFHCAYICEVGDVITIENLQIEERNSRSPFVNGTRGTSDLGFNLHDSLGLDWNGNWSILYSKIPVGTSTSKVKTGYSLESLGSNSNSVGGGYRWWGKPTGQDTVGHGTYDSVDINAYFGNLNTISIIKNGTVITFKWVLNDGQIITKTSSLGTVATNYFVTQYGYDLKLGGWDNVNVCNTFFKDLIVVPNRALSDTEVENIYKEKMNINTGQLTLHNGILTGEVL